jgi:hypothetical protein
MITKERGKKGGGERERERDREREREREKERCTLNLFRFVLFSFCPSYFYSFY